MRLLTILLLGALPAFTVSDASADCDICPSLGAGHVGMWSQPYFKGSNCVCIEALNKCTDLADFNDKTVSFRASSEGAGCRFYLHVGCTGDAYYTPANRADANLGETAGKKNEEKHTIPGKFRGAATHGSTWAENLSSVMCFE
ncbi:hypothetical protein BU23DRAFT_65155 [Bimuria novae-zelandiae CBS 107.79]|uniref:Secreted protein n=1 Tax=Bimuria novae-zelandiae CBS 107.79 TaxID=1447943 RepID=A0A6A5VER1_9PLEO|nr:hypothetical protein BU23DRAFT_65155 [Bimuria novae-zelandiae CBS 107.79]